nr:putative ribonuclease H-like domain-containing protein [Tanacetum cinerariifolium]
CSYSFVDGILVDGASWSIDVDTCDLDKSTALGAGTTGIEEIEIGKGLKCSSNMGWKKRSQSSLDNGTEFVNQTLRSYYESVGISHETSVARSPQQNGVIERQNRTLVEVARTMLIYAKALLFLWAEAVATACYTKNRSIILRHHGKTPYELLHDRKPDIP